eukprot:TRINITY_DN9765_c0_g1_i2.p1 TRINITY_DN9765_c0_g1~~TRINITY_DN9765_c0_g1_i2.p1  ORF type:complete len:192 (-),score=39.08 TRINITY_DN9765_c0_g1_i2:68-643(-)
MEAGDEREPQRDTPIQPCNFAFFRVEKYEAPCWLTPSAERPQVGEHIFTIQFNGEVRSLEEYSDVEVRLSAVGVSEAHFPHRCSVSVGHVKAVNETTMALSASCLPGAAGAPCVAFQQVNMFCGLYVGSLRSEGKPRKFLKSLDGHALLATHPHFVSVFARVVLPDLLDFPSKALDEFLSKHHKQKTNEVQ